jgi:ribonuclease R
MTAGTPAGTLVAVLAKRGRFLLAEPFFAESRSDDQQSRRRSSEQIVITPGSRGAGRAAAAGDLVLLHTPGPARRRSGPAGRPRILRVIGHPDVASDVIEALMLDRGLRRGFDRAVEREATEAAAQRDVALDREDLRDLATFTIDPQSAGDFDDAISARSLDDGTLRVWVHIADVSAHVREGSPLDREARRRATSVYVPGAVEPMLPQSLSGDACSLLPNTDRLAITVELDLDGANIKRVAFHRSIIRSDARLTYEQVDRIFAGADSAEDPWGSSLAVARGAAAALESERQRRGALTLGSSEPEFSFDHEGHVSEISARRQTESHRLIEHLMIAANEAVARRLQQHKTPCLYRVHERPDPERIKRLVDQLASLEVPTPPLPEHISSSQAADLLSEISMLVERHVARARARARAADPRALSTGGSVALTSLLLRSLKQAYYSPRNVGHAGLGSSCYCHFTSPIRRYPDLVCHRALISTLGGEQPAPRAAELAELGAWTSERERQAMKIERDADDVARCFALERLLYERGWRETFSGEITGLISAGAFVAFGSGEPQDDSEPAMPIYEGMIPLRRLDTAEDQRSSDKGPRSRPAAHARRSSSGEDQRSSPRDWWELGEHGTTLHGSRSGATLRLGDQINVRVVGVQAPRGRVDLTVAPS